VLIFTTNLDEQSKRCTEAFSSSQKRANIPACIAGVLRRQSHRRSGLVNLPSVLAVP